MKKITKEKSEEKSNLKRVEKTNIKELVEEYRRDIKLNLQKENNKIENIPKDLKELSIKEDKNDVGNR